MQSDTNFIYEGRGGGLCWKKGDLKLKNGTGFIYFKMAVSF